jgi:hypothetical protein
MKKSGLTFKKNPLAMGIISAATIVDGWMAVSSQGSRASFMGLVVAFVIPAAITFSLLWGVGSILAARAKASSPEAAMRHEASEELTSVAR